MRILYLTYDTTDPTTDKRVRMLQAGGAQVQVAGFRRGDLKQASNQEMNVKPSNASLRAAHIDRDDSPTSDAAKQSSFLKKKLDCFGASEVITRTRKPNTPRNDAVLYYAPENDLNSPFSSTDFGRTYPARFSHRIFRVLMTLHRIRTHRALLESCDLVLARNLEMLAIAVCGIARTGRSIPLVYECLDIHRLMLRGDFIGRALRALEGRLTRHAALLLTSSPAFVREYFEARSEVKLPVRLLENKRLMLDRDASLPPALPAHAPWRIGWFGVLRCRKSFEALCALVTQYPGLVEVMLRGRPAYDQIPDFDARVAATPGLQFGGAYAADELPALYTNIHFAWAIDYFEEGQNSRWLLPNRLYDSGAYGAVPLAVRDTQTADFMAQHTIGKTFADISPTTLAAFFATLTPTDYTTLRNALLATPRDLWRFTRDDCTALVNDLVSLSASSEVTFPTNGLLSSSPLEGQPNRPCDLVGGAPLVILPTLNEARYLPALLDYLAEEMRTTPMRIVVVDGGSTDGTIDIITRAAAGNPAIHYLPNPKRIQSAGINRAVAQFGYGSDYLIRLDAHAHYPRGFCAALLAEAAATNADAVVVRMRSRGASWMQSAIAMTQNSRLGNDGSAHRRGARVGAWVEHGHHALMRIAAFRAVGGYDESFTHNEDAELDIRLTRAGHRLWLTATTSMDYIPRATLAALFRQYRHYGRGRARTTRKHAVLPKLRQTLPLLVAPACALLVLSPFVALAALPFTLWALLCLIYGLALAARHAHGPAILSGPAAMVMHSAWSLGFWQEFLQKQSTRA